MSRRPAGISAFLRSTAVLEVVDLVTRGFPADTQRLVAKLEQATGVSLSELARHAQQWREF
jgi:hypothetical protein